MTTPYRPGKKANVRFRPEGADTAPARQQKPAAASSGAGKTVRCPKCGWKSKPTTSDPKHVLAGHGSQCPKRKGPNAAERRRRERTKWRDWRTDDMPYKPPKTAREMHELKLKQRGVK